MLTDSNAKGEEGEKGLVFVAVKGKGAYSVRDHDRIGEFPGLLTHSHMLKLAPFFFFFFFLFFSSLPFL